MKTIRWLLIIVAGIVVVVIVAALAAPFVPAEAYKPRLIAFLEHATGRNVAINGPLSFSILPRIGLEASDVVVANPPGAAAPDMARFSKLQIAVQALPLLHGDVEITRLVLVDPVIALEIDKQGRPNWQRSGAAPAPAHPGAAEPAPGAPSAAGGAGALSGLTLADVRLVNGRISYVDDRSGARQEASDIAMRLSLRSLDAPFAADGSAMWRNETVTLVLSLADPRALLDGKTSGTALKLDSKPVSFDFKGEATGSTPAKLDGTIDLQVPSVRRLAAWAGTPLTLPGNGLGPLAISGKVALAGPEIAFRDASFSLDTIKAKGELALDSAGARPALKGRLDVDRLDLNPYLPSETAGKPYLPSETAGKPASTDSKTGDNPGAPGGTPAATSAGWSDKPLDLTPLKSADVDFALTAGSLQYRKVQVGKSALGLSLQNGRLEADLTDLALYQGAAKGKVVLDGSGAVPGVEAEFNLDKVAVKPLLRDAIDLDRLSGTGAVNFSVGGHGKSQRDIIADLTGKGDLDLTNGAIKGVDLVSMAKNALAAIQGGTATAQQTQFTSLTGSFTIVNGVLHNDDLQLTSAQLPMTGAGTVDLLHRSVDYKVTPRIARTAVPVLIKGPWDQLKYRPDLAGMGNKLLQEGEKGVGGAGANVNSVLKGLLGGQK
jgi:AsmA protein